MQKLEKEEMLKIEGGVSPTVIVTAVTALITFIIGSLEGYANPRKCN